MNGVEIWKIYQRSRGLNHAGAPWLGKVGYDGSSDARGALLEHRLAATQVVLAFGWVSTRERPVRFKTTTSPTLPDPTRCALLNSFPRP